MLFIERGNKQHEIYMAKYIPLAHRGRVGYYRLALGSPGFALGLPGFPLGLPGFALDTQGLLDTNMLALVT